MCASEPTGSKLRRRWSHRRTFKVSGSQCPPGYSQGPSKPRSKLRHCRAAHGACIPETSDGQLPGTHRMAPCRQRLVHVVWFKGQKDQFRGIISEARRDENRFSRDLRRQFDAPYKAHTLRLQDSVEVVFTIHVGILFGSWPRPFQSTSSRSPQS